MSGAKRAKIWSPEGSECADEDGDGRLRKKPDILVDLGNGMCGKLRIDGADEDEDEDAVVEEGRWKQFKEELYKSELWQQQCKDRGSLRGARKEILDAEIQRAWDESGKARVNRTLLTEEEEEKEQEEQEEEEEEEENALGDGSWNAAADAAGQLQRRKKKKQKRELESADELVMLKPGLQRYLVTLEYSGSRFLGWQKQKNRADLRTVQGVLEEAFNKFMGAPVVCSGSSRTDTGVHALANVCHVDAERVSKRKPGEVVIAESINRKLPAHPPEVVKRAVNHFLQCVAQDFHSRFQARERTYHYRIVSGNALPSIFERDRAWNIPESLNLSAMVEASQVLMGHHDFSSFRATGCQAKSPVKTLDELHICEMPAWPCFPSFAERIPHSKTSEEHEAQGNSDSKGSELNNRFTEVKTSRPCSYVITARARSFLYHQVRLLVGTLKAVGVGLLTVDDVKRILEARSIKATPAMAPAHGLYLAEVKYDLEHPKTKKVHVNIEDE